ncbi:colicin transporter [Bifidobacterium thermacidophilum]|uniref:Colicin transporter n=1 Tax=Bifidobacterium thermacidophilum TaxID=246618 RepID=A0ABW8KNK0_9BIFI
MTDQNTDDTDTTVIPAAGGTPAADATGATGGTHPMKPSRKRLVAAAVAVVLVLAGMGGVALWRHRQAEEREALELTQARDRCAKTADARRLAQNDWQALVDGDAAAMAKTDKASVKDTGTLDKLRGELDAKTPTAAACTGDTASRVDAKTRRVGQETAWYRRHTASLTKAVKAVETSILDKTVADGQALLASSEGKVADEATRSTLRQAVDKRDADAIRQATGKVQASMKAKQEADEAAARAKAEAEAAAAAAAAQAQAQAQAHRSSGTTTRRTTGQSGTRRQSGTTGSNRTYTQPNNNGSGSSSTGNSSNSGTSSGGSSSDSGQLPWYLQTDPNSPYSCAAYHARGEGCPIG